MKMKLGDLEMSHGQGIEFGAGSTHQSKKQERPVVGKTKESLPLPALSKTSLLLVATACFLATVVLLVVAFWSSAFLFFIPLPGLLILTLGAFIMALRSPPDSRPDEVDLSEVATTRRTRIFTHLQKAKRPLTIEALQRDLQWTEEALLKALQGLLNQGRITEDLDLQSGHWVYELHSDPVVLGLEHKNLKTLPLGERLEAIAPSHSHHRNKD